MEETLSIIRCAKDCTYPVQFTQGLDAWRNDLPSSYADLMVDTCDEMTLKMDTLQTSLNELHTAFNEEIESIQTDLLYLSTFSSTSP